MAILAAAAVSGLPSTSRSQAAAELPRAWVGLAGVYASPQGEFKDYVKDAVGVNGHYIQALNDAGILSFRAEVGYLVYGSKTTRQSLGGGALGAIGVDVKTTNNIVHGGLGLQLMSPGRTIRPYLTASAGYSYFFTESAVSGSGGTNTPFATNENYHDSGFTTSAGGGFYVPLRRGERPVELNFAAQYHQNPDITYLTKNSITVSGNNAPVITPVESSANYIAFRLGLVFGVR